MAKFSSSDYGDRVFKITILQWSLVGLFLRLILMPFTLHTIDLFFINYFPYQLIRHGVWDIYRFIRETAPGMTATYYGPVGYFLMACFLFVLKNFLPELDSIMGVFGSWFFTQGGGTIHYADFLGGFQLFRTLFILKTPYLFFDFASALLILQLARNREEGLRCYQLWMLNPLVLHSVYAIGQMEIITVFFTVAALYCASRERAAWAIVFLVLGGLVKVYPFIFIPLVVLLSGKNIRGQLKLTGIAGLLFILILLPFYFSSKGAVLDSVFISSLDSVTGGFLRKAFFMAGYGFLLFYAYRERGKKEIGFLLGKLMLLVFLLYALVGLMKFRYLTWVSPFLILAISRDQKLGWLSLLFLLFISEVRLTGNQVQWGLLSPVCPAFFASLPILDSFLAGSPWLLSLVHQTSYRLSLAVMGLILYRVFRWQKPC